METTNAPFRQAEDLPPREEMYRALVERDASYEGLFFLAVRTTGIFCRPTCPARKPKPENVDFFGSTREALTAGYRPCRRCTPMDPQGAAPEWLEGLLRDIDTDPARRWKDADLREAGLDPARVRRWFKKHHGMTFHAYQRARVWVSRSDRSATETTSWVPLTTTATSLSRASTTLSRTSSATPPGALVAQRATTRAHRTSS